MKKCFFTILSLVVMLTLVFFVGTQFIGADVLENFDKFEEKIYCNATIEDDFDGSSVLVVMDKNIGGINKVHDESFFGDFPKEYIRDLTELTVNIEDALIDVENFHQILQIKLLENSKENALRIIKQLSEIKGILYAGPN